MAEKCKQTNKNYYFKASPCIIHSWLTYWKSMGFYPQCLVMNLRFVLPRNLLLSWHILTYLMPFPTRFEMSLMDDNWFWYELSCGNKKDFNSIKRQFFSDIKIMIIKDVKWHLAPKLSVFEIAVYFLPHKKLLTCAWNLKQWPSGLVKISTEKCENMCFYIL